MQENGYLDGIDGFDPDASIDENMRVMKESKEEQHKDQLHEYMKGCRAGLETAAEKHKKQVILDEISDEGFDAFNPNESIDQTLKDAMEAKQKELNGQLQFELAEWGKAYRSGLEAAAKKTPQERTVS
jgi:hypothetical protein